MLSLYLLMSSYTYLRVATAGVHRLSYGGMGATEFRLLVAAWSLFAYWLGPQVVEARLWRFTVLDVTIGTASAIAFALFVWMVRQDLSRMDRDDEQETATVHRLPTRRAWPSASWPSRPRPSPRKNSTANFPASPPADFRRVKTCSASKNLRRAMGRRARRHIWT